MFIVTDLQATEPDALPTRTNGVQINVAADLDSMGFNRVDVIAPTKEALVGYVIQGWGMEDETWFKEYVLDRIVEYEEESDEAPGLMVCADGAEIAFVPLKDGDDPFNAEAERGALDRAYEAKESNPDSVVSVVIVRTDSPDFFTADDLAFAADNLENLAGLDEGEHTDYERLLRVAKAMRSLAATPGINPFLAAYLKEGR